MSARDNILNRIRDQRLAPRERTANPTTGIRYDDPAAQFTTMLQTVGGTAVFVNSLDEIPGHLAQIESFAGANKVCSVVPELTLPAGTRELVDVDAIDDPHDLADLDFAVLPGEFAIAENGAVWVTNAGLKHRVLYFLPQHLSLVVTSGVIVSNMHQAYDRLQGAFTQPGFGAFVSGPSKTADIEQSLVIGAHGARSLTVFLVKN